MTEHLHGNMSSEDFRRAGHAMIDWIADYLDRDVARYPVRSQVEPGWLRPQLPASAPESGESWEAIWTDFETKILPGVTHWQSPHFYAYFPANVSYPAILGELLSAGLGVNGMLWATSPAATELETHVLDWLVDAMDLPPHFKGGGVIQDTASSASLCALLCAREQVTGYVGVRDGTGGGAPLRAYVSEHAHSSIEKAAMILGIGSSNVIAIPGDETHAMRPGALRKAIEQDLRQGLRPCFVCATIGTTSSLAMDPVDAIGKVCREHDLWLHVDAAMAGTALICPEFRAMADGLSYADSYCFNPHKWMFTNFDCDAFYVCDPSRLIRAMSIMPEYLKTADADGVINYRDWHIPLGRRFRALKLWFVLRSFGIEGIRARIREHVALAREFASWIDADDRFERCAPCDLNLVCFRMVGSDDENRRLMSSLNDAGQMYLTHTILDGRFVLRLCIGQTTTTRQHVQQAWAWIQGATGGLAD